MEKQLIVLWYVNDHPGKISSICLFKSSATKNFGHFAFLTVCHRRVSVLCCSFWT